MDKKLVKIKSMKEIARELFFPTSPLEESLVIIEIPDTRQLSETDLEKKVVDHAPKWATHYLIGKINTTPLLNNWYRYSIPVYYVLVPVLNVSQCEEPPSLGEDWELMHYGRIGGRSVVDA